MRPFLPRLTVRRILMLVAVCALVLGIRSERGRMTRFRHRAMFYQSEANRYRSASVGLHFKGRSAESARSAALAARCQALSRWYSSHLLWGGKPPADRELERLFDRLFDGWPIDIAYQRAGVVVLGTVDHFDWNRTHVTFRVLKTYKGSPSGAGPVTVSTRRIQPRAAMLERGASFVVFYVEDPKSGNPACQIHPDTPENRVALEEAKSAR